MHFCVACGARSQSRVRLLGTLCRQTPGSATTARTLAGLKNRILPGETKFHARPVPTGDDVAQSAHFGFDEAIVDQAISVIAINVVEP